jgi:hypothetical protein
MRKDELIKELQHRGIQANGKMSKKTLEAMLKETLSENKGVIGAKKFIVEYKSKGRYFTMPDKFDSIEAAKLEALMIIE